MDENLTDFQRLITELAKEGPGGSAELLLRKMEARKAWALRLCAIPHEFDASILRALAHEITEYQAQAYCEEFSRLSMIVSRDQRLAIHDELRRHLFNKWLNDAAPEFVVASARLVEYFEARIGELTQISSGATGDQIESAERDRMFHLIGASRESGLTEFERLCRERREQLRLGECEALIKLVHEYDPVLSQIEAAVVTYHEGKLAADRQDWRAAEELYSRVVGTAGVPLWSRVKALRRLGMVNDRLRHWSAAINFFKLGLDAADARPDLSSEIVRLHLNLGSTYRDSGNLTASHESLQKGIALAEAGNDVWNLADGYNSLGTLFLKLNDNRKAIEAYEKSLKRLTELGDSFRPAQVYNNLGNAYANDRNWEESEKLFSESLKIKCKAGDNSGQAMTLTNLVRVYGSQEKFAEAIAASEQAGALFGEVRDEYNAAIAKRNLGRLYRAMQNTELARRALGEASDLFVHCNMYNEAEATRNELSELDRKSSLPWWIWLFIGLFVLLVILVIALIVIALIAGAAK